MAVFCGIALAMAKDEETEAVTWPWKQLLGLGLLILILNGTLLLLSSKVFLESFIRLENNLAQETLQRGGRRLSGRVGISGTHD